MRGVFSLRPNYLIICRSLTYAQRVASVLERAGIRAPIQRAPSLVAEDGCSHAVRVAEKQLGVALKTLNRADMTPNRIFLQTMGGECLEVEF